MLKQQLLQPLFGYYKGQPVLVSILILKLQTVKKHNTAMGTLI